MGWHAALLWPCDLAWLPLSPASSNGDESSCCISSSVFLSGLGPALTSIASLLEGGPLSSRLWHPLQPQASEDLGVRRIKGSQAWESRAQLPSTDLFTWKLSLKGISFLLPYLCADTLLPFKRKRKKKHNKIPEKVGFTFCWEAQWSTPRRGVSPQGSSSRLPQVPPELSPA